MSIKQRAIFALLLSAAALSFIVAGACRNRNEPPDTQADIAQAGEPDQYSAIIVRTVETAAGREESAVRIARSGDMRREEWTEMGEKFALIWRPDLDKIFLLSLDRQFYVERNLIPETAGSIAGSGTNGPDGRLSPEAESIEHAFDDAPAPVSVETRALPDQTIDNRLCSVTENRASFADGRIEVTRTFRARDLEGLALRIESESETTGVKVVTERRDIKIEVAASEFTVPSDFKRVARLSAR